MKVMLDECMTLRASRLVIDALQLHKPPIHAIFLEEYLGQKGGLDVDWTKLLMEEGGWCVVTCDNGKAKGAKARLRGPPLHLILPARRITGFFLAGKMASRPGVRQGSRGDLHAARSDAVRGTIQARRAVQDHSSRGRLQGCSVAVRRVTAHASLTTALPPLS